MKVSFPLKHVDFDHVVDTPYTFIKQLSFCSSNYLRGLSSEDTCFKLDTHWYDVIFQAFDL